MLIKQGTEQYLWFGSVIIIPMVASAQTQSWTTLSNFSRFEYLAVAIIFPLIGSATAITQLTGFHLLGILGGAIAFHIYVSLLNDIVDLPLDRTNPARAAYPLVSGRISVGTALLITLIQIPIAAAIIYWQSGPPTAYFAMALALGMMTIYNIWGKRSSFPPAMDVIQGLGFSSLVLYGAALTGGLTSLSWLTFALGILWMVIINLLGGLRDLRSDLAFGVNTTPIYFGMRPTGREETVPSFLPYYGYVLHVLMMAVGILVVLWNDQRYSFWLQTALIILSFLGGMLALFFLITMFNAAPEDYDVMVMAGLRYIGTSAAALFLTLLPALPWWVSLGVIVLFFWTYHNYSLTPILAYWQHRKKSHA
ncbi:MAG TPA: UbiA family prenyltransferase [Anaerolineales bacterium]|nr:UbiA family prenyltransferase [Anaerolineales bacterium]